MRMLYISSNVEQVLYFEPSEVVGKPSFSYLAYGTSQEYLTLCEPNSDDNVTIFYAYIIRKNAQPVFMRAIHFNCDGVGFNVCFVCPDRNHSPERFPFTIEDPTAHGQSMLTLHTNPVQVSYKKHATRPRNVRKPTARLRENSCQAQQRSTGPQLVVRRACLVLGSLNEADVRCPQDPRVLFASSTFDKIIGADACDIQQTPFIALVAPQDILKAVAFLEKVAVSEGIVLETLSLKYSPFDSDENGSTEHVCVEVLGAGSVNGAILLCQLKYPGLKIGRRNHESDAGYLSLGDIISTDAETSDFPNWNNGY
ncbi:hypothetical protein IWW50_000393 [Coemansia erecta]|nr:hypothetical protein IWW50_000393 [Coemansia erecta]